MPPKTWSLVHHFQGCLHIFFGRGRVWYEAICPIKKSYRTPLDLVQNNLPQQIVPLYMIESPPPWADLWLLRKYFFMASFFNFGTFIFQIKMLPSGLLVESALTILDYRKWISQITEFFEGLKLSLWLKWIQFSFSVSSNGNLSTDLDSDLSQFDLHLGTWYLMA